MSNYTQQKIRLGTVCGRLGDDPLILPQNFPWFGGNCHYVLQE